MNVQVLCAINHRATLSCLHIHSTKFELLENVFTKRYQNNYVYVPLGDINSPHTCMTPAKSTSLSSGSLQEVDEACGRSH